MKANLIVADNETGGLLFKENPITEVCLYIISPSTFKVIDKYKTYVRPYNKLKITQKAIEATQVNIKDVEAGIELKTMVTTMIVYFKKAKNGAKYDLPQVIFHNASFDIDFWEYAFELCGKNLFDYIDRVPICTMRMISLHDAGTKNEKDDTTSISLSASCERFGIKLKSAHGAENDVVATLALFKALTSKLRALPTTKDKTVVEEKVVEEKSRRYFQF